MAWFNEKHPTVQLEDIEQSSVFLPWRPPEKDVPCLLCGEGVNFKKPGVYWANASFCEEELGGDLKPTDGVLFLHPECAMRLAANLCKDALLALNKEYMYEASEYRTKKGSGNK
jgi:hypothetical protein